MSLCVGSSVLVLSWANNACRVRMLRRGEGDSLRTMERLCQFSSITPEQCVQRETVFTVERLDRVRGFRERESKREARDTHLSEKSGAIEW